MGYYKIKDLEQLSGIKAHTIRIWEKRYNIITPERTDTNIRRYTDKDLRNLLLIAILNKNGYKISKLADLSDQERVDLAEKSVLESDDHDVSFDKLILSMIEIDEIKFSQEIDYLFNKYGVTETFIKFLFPFVERIGVMWKIGSITPVQEHFITNLMRQKLIAKIDALSIPVHSHKKIILYLPEHEYHEISLLLYNYIIRSTGKFTYYLGQTLPFEDLIKAIDEIKPDAVVGSFITGVDKKKFLNYVEELQSKTKHDFQLVLGGMQCELYKNDLPASIKLINSVASLIEL